MVTESVDQNADGTADEITTCTYDADGYPLSVTEDSDADGTVNSIMTYTWTTV